MRLSLTLDVCDPDGELAASDRDAPEPAADEFSELCELAALAPGGMRRVEHAGQSLAVFNVAGEFYVTDDTCTHGFASLAEGTLDTHVVTCPWHGGAFDVRTGEALEPPCRDALRVHACERRNGALWVKVTR